MAFAVKSMVAMAPHGLGTPPLFSVTADSKEHTDWMLLPNGTSPLLPETLLRLSRELQVERAPGPPPPCLRKYEE